MSVARSAGQRTRGSGSAATEPATPPRPATAIPPVHFDHEELVVRTGRRSGLYVIVAIHSTALGPALGGVRLWHYAATVDGVRDALRLAQRDDLQGGGGRARPRRRQGRDLRPGRSDLERASERRAVLLDFGDLVESLDGRYITAEDVGIVARRPGRDRASGPSTSPGCRPTAAARAIRARSRRSGSRRRCAPAPARASARPDLAGRAVVVVGLGHVGASARAAARRRRRRAGRLRHRPGEARARRRARRQWVEPDDGDASPSATCSPRARSAARSTPRTLPLLRCEIVCGSANNQLADEALADALAERGDPLRAGLHRQRRRPDPRLQGDQGLLGARGARARARDRGQPRPRARDGRRARDHAAAPRRASSPGAARRGSEAGGRRMRN